MRLLEGKVAIVTGAGRGIGRAVVHRFAAEGARIVVNDLGCDSRGLGRDPDLAVALAEEVGESAVPSSDDVSTVEGARAVVRRGVEAFGTVDVLVCAAGIRRDGSLLDLDVEDLDSVLRTQLRGTFLCTQAAAAVLVPKGQGRIVHVVGLAGLLGSAGHMSASLAEAGVYGLTRTAAIELERSGVRVNAVAPVARTRLTQDIEALDGMASVTADHVAPVVLYLASDLAGDLSGELVTVTGGRLSRQELVSSRGQYKAGEPWTPQEIASHWEAVCKR
jgi:NAD(P)-dependent dehydrogenase (short-subunit alcohol dehydrogenase family)